MRRYCVALCVSLALLCSSAWASSTFQSIDSLKAVPDYVESVLIKKEKIPPQRILIVFDDDNTLLTTPKYCPSPQAVTCQYLGGDAWYAWQQDLLKNHPKSPDLVANSQAGLDQIQALLFDLVPMQPTEADLPQLIARLNDLDVTVMIETARGPHEAGATWHQLMYNKLPFRSRVFGDSLESYSLEAKQCGHIEWGSQPASVRNGVLYTSGRNKGKMLSCLLKKTKRKLPYQAIVMVDDDKKNLDHVKDTLSQDYQLHLFEYTKMHSAVQAFLHGPKKDEYQKQAAKLWHRLKDAIASTFPALNF